MNSNFQEFLNSAGVLYLLMLIAFFLFWGVFYRRP